MRAMISLCARPSSCPCHCTTTTINYQYNKRRIKVEFIKCKTIHSGLLLIFLLQLTSLRWFIGMVLFLFSWYRATKRQNIFYYLLTHNDSLILDMFMINCHGNFFSHKYLICCILNIFCHIFSKQSKNSINLDFGQQHISQNTKFLLP